MTGNGLQRVMVAEDAGDGLDVALGKALRITARDGRILVLRTCYDAVVEEPEDVMPPTTRDELRDAVLTGQRAALDSALRPHADERRIEARVEWTRDSAGTMVETAAHWPAQLLIKPVSRHHPVADYFHTPLDWSLMRRAPCPVLVSKGETWAQPTSVLAAVDAGDVEHAALCREILRQAAALAAALQVDLHVVCAYPDLGQTVNELQVASDFAGIKSDMRAARQRSVTGMAAELDVSIRELHLLEGRAASVVAELADRLPATVTVLGSAARGGLAKLMIGNTAEDLIGRLPGDLLTVREPWS
ncbi:MAG: universal stress protein [Pseudomonadales bacterium]